MGTGLLRFGVFEANPASGELFKQGRRVRLQAQPFQVLLMLLERPGEVVTREQIRLRLWPEGTFVDFDHGLNTAINKLRDILGDSANSPRYIETLAKRGYRFLAPVQAVTAEPSSPPTAVAAPAPQSAAPALQPSREPSGPVSRYLTRPEHLPQVPRKLVRVLFSLIQLMYLCFYVISLARLSQVQEEAGDIVGHVLWVTVLLIITAVIGIPARLYLLSAVSFGALGLRENFLNLFPILFPLDELWALAPFLLLHEIGLGLALGATAALLYVPFAQRSLILMGAGSSLHRDH